MTIPFNLNDDISVRLTDEGRRIHRENFDSLMSDFPQVKLEYTPPKEDPEGWSRWQAWVLMREFGPFMSMGAPQPFSMEAKIHVNEK